MPPCPWGWGPCSNPSSLPCPLVPGEAPSARRYGVIGPEHWSISRDFKDACKWGAITVTVVGAPIIGKVGRVAVIGAPIIGMVGRAGRGWLAGWGGRAGRQGGWVGAAVRGGGSHPVRCRGVDRAGGGPGSVAAQASQPPLVQPPLSPVAILGGRHCGADHRRPGGTPPCLLCRSTKWALRGHWVGGWVGGWVGAFRAAAVALPPALLCYC